MFQPHNCTNVYEIGLDRSAGSSNANASQVINYARHVVASTSYIKNEISAYDEQKRSKVSKVEAKRAEHKKK